MTSVESPPFRLPDALSHLKEHLLQGDEFLKRQFKELDEIRAELQSYGELLAASENHLAMEQAALAETRAREYEVAFQAVRQEVYRQREAERKRTLAEREAALEISRKVADSQLVKMRAELAEEMEKAKRELNLACQTLAAQIATSLVGNGAGPGPGRVN